MKKNFVIQPTAGLSNCLRVVFSYYYFAKKHNLHLIVIWKVTSACNGFFLDYFEEIDGITFYRNNSLNFKINYTGYDFHKKFNPYRKFIYKELKLKPFLIYTLTKKLFKIKKYISVHIRRTDHVNLAKRKNLFTTDEEFIKFIDDNKKNKNLFIATDNHNSYNKFKKLYRDKVKLYYYNITSDRRKTKLREAIVDIYMCALSNKFKGSGYSTFSDLIISLKSNIKYTKKHFMDVYFKYLYKFFYFYILDKFIFNLIKID